VWPTVWPPAATPRYEHSRTLLIVVTRPVPTPGVDAPLSACSHVLYRGAQAGAATRRCPTLLQQEKGTRKMCKASVRPPVWPSASTSRYEHVRTLLAVVPRPVLRPFPAAKRLSLWHVFFDLAEARGRLLSTTERSIP
jgi:hypothetical protein